MSDSTINRFVGQGTNAEMMAFTPSPPTPASGPDQAYYFYDTDNDTFNWWDGANWVSLISSGTGTVTNTGTLTDHALIVGNGGVDVSALGSLGTTADYLQGNASGDPTWAAWATPATFQARLTGTTGVAVTTSDVTAIATIYLTAYKGYRVSLYTSSKWTSYSLSSDVSLALTGLIKGATYDLFLYDNTGTLTLEAVAWKKVASSSSPTSGSNKTLNLTDTATLAVGMWVGIKDGSNSEIAVITAVVASTSITVASLANSYTTPDVYGYRARTTALTTQDGVYVKTGETNKRYCGSLTITSTTGQTEDSLQRRLVFNYYNRVSRPMQRLETTDSWGYSTATMRQANGSLSNQLEITCGVVENPISATVIGVCQNSTTTLRSVTVAVGNNVTTAGSGLMGRNFTSSQGVGNSIAAFDGFPSLGFNYFAWLEKGNGTDTQTWYGDDGSSGNIQSGITGRWSA